MLGILHRLSYPNRQLSTMYTKIPSLNPLSTPHLAEDEGEDHHAGLPENKKALLDRHWEFPQPQKATHRI